MKKTNNKIGFSLIEVIIIIVISTTIAGLSSGVIAYNIFKTKNSNASMVLSQDSNLNEFIEVYSSITSDYYEKVDKEKLITSAINAMFTYLGDDYSSYLNKNQSDALNTSLNAEYEGIGVQLSTDNIIVDVFDDSPASKAGIKTGDIVEKINGLDVTKFTPSEVATKIKESTSGQINLSLKRDKKQFSVTVTKDNLYIPTISYKVLDYNNKKIGYLYISSFSKNVYNQVSGALKRMEDNKIKSLIIDVRGNTGGYLDSAQNIANLFLEKDKIIYSLENKSGKEEYRDKTDEKRDYDIVVLIDGQSASASEILATALKDSYGATLVGEKSYGKGKIQQAITLEDGSMAKYTTAKWLRPNGDCIDGIGIKPDFEAKVLLDKNGNIKDLQLNKALEILQ